MRDSEKDAWKTEDYRRTVGAEVADRQPYIYLSNDYNRTQS